MTALLEPDTAGVPATIDAPLPPPDGARGERLLGSVDRALAWLDSCLARWLPAEANPLAQAGAAANFSLSVAVLSGVALLAWYSSSVQSAYASLAAIPAGTLGGWVRAMHRYSSDLAMAFMLVHAVRVFFARKFTGARWLPWVTGVALVALVWFIGWTGYWLVWDQPAQQVAVTSMRLLDGLPIFGEPLGRLYLADRLVPSLLFFVVFFLHMLLPLGIALGLAIHLVRLNRVKLFPNARVGAALLVGLAVAALLVPAPLDVRAQMAVKAPAFTVDTWFLAPLALALRFQHAGLWLALFGSTAVAAAIPWLLGRRRTPSQYQTVVEASRCHACTQCVQDCPFDAVSMVPRTDGKRFSSQAFVDPARCVGCGVCVGSCDSEAMSLTWFATVREETRIAAEVAAARVDGEPTWVALVAGDIDGGLAAFSVARWRERLPHFQVHCVPTASWVRSKFVERLLADGAGGVLIVRDARVEAAARDGQRWVLARLARERAPKFRPERAGDSNAWFVADFDPSRPGELTRIAAAFRQGGAASSVERPRPRPVAVALAGIALTFLLAAATVAPSHLRVSNPAPADPEFVFSFKALGQRIESAASDPVADAAKPIHMRGRSTQKPHRADVLVRLTIDGTTQERTFRAKGISRDGPALDEWRQSLAPGTHRIDVEIVTGAAVTPLRWSGVIEAQTRRIHVVTFEPDGGFRVE